MHHIEIMKIISQQWKLLSAHQKKAYHDRALTDKERYEIDRQQFIDEFTKVNQSTRKNKINL